MVFPVVVVTRPNIKEAFQAAGFRLRRREADALAREFEVVLRLRVLGV